MITRNTFRLETSHLTHRYEVIENQQSIDFFFQSSAPMIKDIINQINSQTEFEQSHFIMSGQDLCCVCCLCMYTVVGGCYYMCWWGMRANESKESYGFKVNNILNSNQKRLSEQGFIGKVSYENSQFVHHTSRNRRQDRGRPQ